MQTTTLQVPMSKTLKSDATAVAKNMGFSSLQEVVRVFINKLAHKQLSISVSDTKQLTNKNDLRYDQLINELKSSQVNAIKLNDKQAMIDYLESQ